MDFTPLKTHLRGKVTILCHHNADPDAIGSAYAIQRLVKLLDPQAITEILYPDSASQLSDKIIAYLGIEASTHPRIVGADTIVVVDTGSIGQLENLSHLLQEGGAKIFIDHHSRDPGIERVASIYLMDGDAVATCEIVCDIWQGIGGEPPKEVAEALLLGIAYDSKHFTIGTPRTFRTVARLLELGATMNGVRGLLSSVMDPSEKLARLKATQRMTIIRVDPWIIATSNLGSFQPSAARGILNLGADVVVIAGNDKEVLKASLRSTEEFHQKTGIHLGDDVTRMLSERFKGAGGGHPTAAGINGIGDADDFLSEAAELIREKLGRPKTVL
ncbi:MAG: DHH family phosphoesterase [Candidatus Bathyarchaeota archaeon]|nr:DHH family phosphoesterase [Candidatus Bathyarchaeota archaeon]